MAAGTLSERFLTATSAVKKLDSSVPVVEEVENENGVSALELDQELGAIWSAVMATGCISRNELAEDMATQDLKYVLVPFYRARVSAATPSNGPAPRAAQVSEATEHFAEFTHLVESLEAVDRSSVKKELTELPKSPEERRNSLIARVKAEKEARQRLEALRRSAANAGEDERDEIEREIVFTVITSAMLDTQKSMKSLSEELELLNFAVSAENKGLDPAEESKKAQSNLPPPQTYRIIDNRRYEQEQVFRPSHTLPTYTVEEWGEIEAARMREQTRLEAEKKAQAAMEDDEDSDRDEVSDRKTMEARRWADWTDDNNKGSGNTLS